MLFNTLFLLAFLQPGQILIDKIVGTVNNEIITLSDIEKSLQIFPFLQEPGEHEDDLYHRILNELINYKVVYQEYRNEFTLKEEDYEQIQLTAIERAGSLEKLMARLQKYDMTWADFRSFIRERAFFDKVLREKLQLKITVLFPEIEKFYQDEYSPAQILLKLEPQSLIEMAPVIEKHLRRKKTDEKLAGWLNELKSSYDIEIKLRSR
jgi:parvulin-like peptidyl-prolyl isomerase